MPSVGLRRLVDRSAVGALLVALAIPFLFLHERYQPEATLDVGGTAVDVRLSDVALLAVLVAALVAAVRLGLGRLGAAKALWLTGGLLLAWLAFQALRPVSLDDVRFDDHLVSFAKLVEYALLVPALPLLVRQAEHLTLVLGSVSAGSGHAAMLWTDAAGGLVGGALIIGLALSPGVGSRRAVSLASAPLGLPVRSSIASPTRSTLQTWNLPRSTVSDTSSRKVRFGWFAAGTITPAITETMDTRRAQAVLSCGRAAPRRRAT